MRNIKLSETDYKYLERLIITACRLTPTTKILRRVLHKVHNSKKETK
jgi:hypothetical protein